MTRRKAIWHSVFILVAVAVQVVWATLTPAGEASIPLMVYSGILIFLLTFLYVKTWRRNRRGKRGE